MTRTGAACRVQAWMAAGLVMMAAGCQSVQTTSAGAVGIDRKQNMIITGGENVYPSEVEAVLGAQPKVKDVAVVGIVDPKWGETVLAAVVPHDETQLTGDELDAWCRSRIAGFKRPRGYSFLAHDEMPRTATGKILHRVLRETIERRT